MGDMSMLGKASGQGDWWVSRAAMKRSRCCSKRSSTSIDLRSGGEGDKGFPESLRRMKRRRSRCTQHGAKTPRRAVATQLVDDRLVKSG